MTATELQILARLDVIEKGLARTKANLQTMLCAQKEICEVIRETLDKLERPAAAFDTHQQRFHRGDLRVAPDKL